MQAHLSTNALAVLKYRYLEKDDSGRVIETPEEMFRRVADATAEAERLFNPAMDVKDTSDTFYRLMSELRFLPNSPTLMNAGRDLGQLAACFVLPLEDTLTSVYDSVKNAALIHKSGGGTGYSFSRLRPKNDPVQSTGGLSSGPMAFLEVFNVSTAAVKQGGRRQGANMAMLRVDHPDIEEFITAKTEPDRLTQFNLSVAIPDAFMETLAKKGSILLMNPRSGLAVKRVSAEDLFALIVDGAWRSGEPGVVFIDRMNAHHPVSHLGPIEATNPCGEQPLLPYESCTLGSINLARMMGPEGVDWDLFESTIHDAVRFLDNVIEINRYPIPQIEETTLKTRKIGLGVMGFADALIQRKIPYDSEAAVDFAGQIMAFVQHQSKAASAALGKERGNFPAYAGSLYDTPETPFMRNATTTTIAPTGSISIIADVSSGIEPLFGLIYQREVMDGRRLSSVNARLLETLRELKIDTDSAIQQIEAKGSLKGIEGIPDDIKSIFATSHDIAPQWHVAIQTAFQKYTDNAVSKTVNLPAEAGREDVAALIRLAYEKGCKGLTIYRDGSRDRQVLRKGTPPPASPRLVPRARPERTEGFTQRIQTGCGKLYVTVNSDENGLCEVFAKMGKTGGCASSQIEAAGRLISLALRSGVDVNAVIKQLVGIRCPSPCWQNGQMVLSCPDAMAKVLKDLGLGAATPVDSMQGVCPDCGSLLFPDAGCLMCRDCGYSKCG
jgi:ribonucleoside-diphosphate reductase alpha chain